MINKLLVIVFVILSSCNNDSIINNRIISKHLSTLSDDKMEGRRAGTNGIEKAAKYIESEFERIGLTKYDTLNSYRQNFNFYDMLFYNVIGVLKGKSLPNEYVIISAHYDHLGINQKMEGDNIYNGANDNASGTTAMLALAEYFKKLDNNERSIVFVAFTAEEMGLVGSRYFGKHINPNDIVAGINIEMIGKESPYGKNTAWITGFDRSDFGEIIQKNLSNTNYEVFPDPYIKEKLFFRSDNAALAKLGIPAHTFSTTPMEKDSHYHKVSDEYKTLDIFTIKEATKLISKGILSIIQGEDTPTRIQMN
jgi:Zn-dependent M28 family amino/carboxypeptidase|tara:strand:+ start:153 stop:1076 length:924 start_codon:yes stop_codon:yes gene_type:complete